MGLCITLTAGAIILNEALQPVRPVSLSFKTQRVRQSATSRIFEIVVSNSGSKTAAAVDIVGEAGGETASATLDYVPGDGEASAALVFPATVGNTVPKLSVAGWSEP
jgi:uncharacterized protein (TIGR02588 family)